ncbi:hypothetical protein EYZ11_001542 [Aspergillus tanneri]|uniref:BHLH domain-containing protein n=1 Tax=Aspergillus tanneri TaxID=1220188 RepID=A0A4S3JUC9_9EURO|nr:uncharacterized protein ATNIH1004_007593 [Aspergillus tanneri]KAA8646167.1 hypothetical protein ATNIH1004_007593 [Aspergillus tanneri]THC98991.1 hypothetical protein EYZ11_001542 [Aspergillus tanneri]
MLTSRPVGSQQGSSKMWGKVSFHRSRKPVIGNPTLVNKTLDDNVYQSLSSVAGVKDSERYYSSMTAPSLPPKTAGASFPAHRLDTGHRVASSVYSRDTMIDPVRQRSISLTHQIPSDPGAFSRDQPSRLSTTSSNISPPDSPTVEGGVPQSRSSSQVSPIDEGPIPASGGGPMYHKLSSHLPILSKRTGSSRTESQQRPLRSRSSSLVSDTTEWNAFSLEPTAKDYAETWQMNSGNVSFETHIAANTEPTGSYSSNIFGRGKEQFHPQKKRSGVRSRLSKGDYSPPTAAVRDPWKGPSGRAPIVQHLKEPVRASRSNDRLMEDDKLDFASFGIVPSVVTTITGGETNTKGPEGHVARSNSTRIRLPGRNPAVSTSPAPPRVDLPERDLYASLADLKLTCDDETDQPTSRFSATTYEPTEAGSSVGSRRNSIDTAQSTENFPSIMSRKRPVPSSVAPAKKPSRKPTPSQASNEDEASKDLAQCSPEQQAQNRIEALEARKDSLARRRNNINTIIHELTQVIQPSSVAYDMAAREEVKKTVTSLNNELAEIKREEHEIGLKLFRAWKKRDEQNCYGGGSGLWVKRVTN